MADINNDIERGPVHMGDFPLEAYKQYEEAQGSNPLGSTARDQVGFRSSVGVDTALYDEFTKLAPRFSRARIALVERPHDLSLSPLFLPNAVAAAFSEVTSQLARLDAHTQKMSSSPNENPKRLRTFLEMISELNTLCDTIHTQMSRIGKG
jgi:hypothetical protein